MDRYRGCLVGLAVGDAVGTTVEFKPRGSFEPLADMIGGGPFDLRPGEWTDDTSMALCLATSLVQCRSFDAEDQMKRYCRWHEQGYLSSNGRCFDIGITTARALERLRQSGDPWSGSTAKDSAGNGWIMRLAPVAMAFRPDEDRVMRRCAESSRTTHGTEECVDGCRLLGLLLCRLLSGHGRGAACTLPADIVRSARLKSIARAEYVDKDETSIRSSGYVVDTLEAALWCFHGTDSFKDAILRAANFGEDADTVAAVCGQIAGACYGLSGIPAAWRERVVRGEEITTLADQLLAFA